MDGDKATRFWRFCELMDSDLERRSTGRRRIFLRRCHYYAGVSGGMPTASLLTGLGMDDGDEGIK